MAIDLFDIASTIVIILIIDYSIAFLCWTSDKWYPFGLLLRFWIKLLDDTKYTESQLVEILKPEIIKTLESNDPYDIVHSMELSRKYNTAREYNIRLKIIREYKHENLQTKTT